VTGRQYPVEAAKKWQEELAEELLGGQQEECCGSCFDFWIETFNKTLFR